MTPIDPEIVLMIGSRQVGDWPPLGYRLPQPVERLFFIAVDGKLCAILETDSDMAIAGCEKALKVRRPFRFTFGPNSLMPEFTARIVA